jgi:glycosyltransferase involved in cell wall biosynthesis
MDPDQALEISLIVCTRNRASRLPEFLSRVGAVDFPNDRWELVLVDHASTDDTPELIERFAATSPFRVRTLRSTAKALAGAKNHGIAHAVGHILAFTDDDCYPRTDYLRAIAQVFAEHDVGVMGGRVVLHDPTDARLSIRDIDQPTVIEPGTFVRAGTIHGANLAVVRDVVDAIGGFDPHFGPGTPCVAAEDVEYIARAVWSGWRARYDPRPVVAHHHGRKPGPETDRHRSGYDYGRGAYYTKFLLHPRARNVYLRRWFASSRDGSRALAGRRVLREMAGGMRYLRQRVLQPEPVPMLPRAQA